MIRRAESEIPIPLKEFIKTYPALIEYLGVKQLSRPFYCAVRNELFKPTQEDKDFAEAQRDFEQDQKDRINLARKQIGAWLASANTIEALLESGPQFAAYIPKPEELIARLPALKLAEELGKIGWPKT